MPTPESTATPEPTATATPEPTATATPTATPDPFAEALFLHVTSPEGDEDFVSVATYTVAGNTRIDAIVSVNDQIAEVDQNGSYSATVELEIGPNIVEVVASVASGDEVSKVLTIFYLPEG